MLSRLQCRENHNNCACADIDNKCKNTITWPIDKTRLISRVWCFCISNDNSISIEVMHIVLLWFKLPVTFVLVSCSVADEVNKVMSPI